MPTAEESNAAMAIIAKLQAEHASGQGGLPAGADWVDSAFAYMEHAAEYEDEARVRELLQGYGLLEEAPPPAPPPPSLTEALDLPDWWAGFRAFTETEFSTENPDFVDAVRYQSLTPREIYDTYVKEGAEKQVNISAAQRTAIDGAFADDGQPGHDVLEGAQAEIIRLMSGDSWRRYLATM